MSNIKMESAEDDDNKNQTTEPKSPLSDSKPLVVPLVSPKIPALIEFNKPKVFIII
jgi:hypothetical protein